MPRLGYNKSNLIKKYVYSLKIYANCYIIPHFAKRNLGEMGVQWQMKQIGWRKSSNENKLICRHLFFIILAVQSHKVSPKVCLDTSIASPSEQCKEAWNIIVRHITLKSYNNNNE